MKILERPMTVDEAKAVADKDGFVSAIVRLDLNDAIACGGIDGFCDILSNKLIGDDLLMDISYAVVGCDKETGEILVKVDGDITASLGIEDQGEF